MYDCISSIFHVHAPERCGCSRFKPLLTQKALLRTVLPHTMLGTAQRLDRLNLFMFTHVGGCHPTRSSFKIFCRGRCRKKPQHSAILQCGICRDESRLTDFISLLCCSQESLSQETLLKTEAEARCAALQQALDEARRARDAAAKAAADRSTELATQVSRSVTCYAIGATA